MSCCPACFYGRVLRSPHAHARIVSIDASRALALDGVRGVASYDDLPPHDVDAVLDIGEGAAEGRWMARNVFARDKVLYKGHAVTAVCATDPHIAEDALELIDVEYEPLPPLLDVREAMDPNAPLLHEDLYTEEVAGYGRGGRRRASERPTSASTASSARATSTPRSSRRTSSSSASSRPRCTTRATSRPITARPFGTRRASSPSGTARRAHSSSAHSSRSCWTCRSRR